jgi:hypothetical protein
MKIAIVHHHFRPGGVTKVVSAGAAALLKFRQEIEVITLVSGDREHLEETAKGIFPGAPDKVRVLHYPQLDYRSNMPTGQKPEAESIIRFFEEHLADHLLWVHNYQLGKNGVFTRAVLEYGKKWPDRPVILQIHDFPECGRHGNLDELYRGMEGRIYPVLPNITWAVINERDRRLLVQSGLPEKQIRLLDNPVPDAMVPVPQPDKQMVRSKLVTAFNSCSSTPGRILPDRPHFFYPVRTIRRKNAFEAALLCRVYTDGTGEQANLLLTLPGTSASERPYSDMVQALYQDGIVSGIFGFGRELEHEGLSFEMVARSCDLVLSSSVQEGFGYFFVDALRWGKPLLARSLEILEGIEPLFREYPHHLYSTVLVPVPAHERAELLSQYKKRLQELSPYLTESERESAFEKLGIMTGRALVDFSLLDPLRQDRLLRSLHDISLLRDIRQANEELIKTAVSLAGSLPTPPLQQIEDHFGAESFAERAWALIQELEMRISRTSAAGEKNNASGAVKSSGDPVHRRLLAQFATPEYLRLLYSF